MDITSFIGPFWAVAAIILGMILEGGHLGSILQITAFLIVFGGMSGAMMLAYPLGDILAAIKAILLLIRNPTVSAEELRDDILELASVARGDSVLGLEKRLDQISFRPLRVAVRLAVDGSDPVVLRNTMEVGQAMTHEAREVCAKFWEDCGSIAPTIGILGAVLGLIHVMENLDKPEMIGPGIAIAFVATLYGVGSANILFLPMGKKIKRKAQMEFSLQEMTIIGIEGIITGVNPKVLEERLSMFVNEL